MSVGSSLGYKNFLETGISTYSVFPKDPSSAGTTYLLYVDESKYDGAEKTIWIKPLNANETKCWVNVEQAERIHQFFLCTVDLVQPYGIILGLRDTLIEKISPAGKKLCVEYQGIAHEVGMIAAVKKMELLPNKGGSFGQIMGIYEVFRKSSLEHAKKALAAKGITV